jgi:hypothetical protein
MTHQTNPHKQRGIAILWVTIFLIVFIAIGGLLLDAARVYLVSHQLQNAADAAALAGARYVVDPASSPPGLTARLQAQNFAAANDAAKTAVNLLLNDGNAPEGDIVIGRYVRQTHTFIPTMSNPNAMKVVTRKDDVSNEKLPLLFGSMFGTSFSNIQRYAIAQIYNASGAAVIALSDDETGLHLNGTPNVQIANSGSIYANSVEVDAVDLRGTPDTEVAEINVVGDVSIKGSYNLDSDFTYDGIAATVNNGVDPIEDPYAHLDDSYGTSPDLGTISEAGTIDAPKVYTPGYYSGGIEKPSSGYITLLPGVYHLGGTNNKGGINITNDQCAITAEGVMLHVVSGSVDIRGGNLTLSPPTSGDYAGISIFQSPNNTNDATINGNGKLNMTGVLYFPNNHLSVSGNGDTLGTQLVADTIEISGTGTINIPWEGSPQIVNKSFLVE